MNGLTGVPTSVAASVTGVTGGNPSMSALQVPSMTSSAGITLNNILTIQQLLTGSPLTLTGGSPGKYGADPTTFEFTVTMAAL
jgi:hypothetical protein